MNMRLRTVVLGMLTEMFLLVIANNFFIMHIQDMNANRTTIYTTTEKHEDEFEFDVLRDIYQHQFSNIMHIQDMNANRTTIYTTTEKHEDEFEFDVLRDIYQHQFSNIKDFKCELDDYISITNLSKKYWFVKLTKN
eukprot:75934_1